MLRGLTPTRLVLLGSALLVSAGLLLIASGADRGIPKQAPRRITDPELLVPPHAVSDAEATRAGDPGDLRGGMQLDQGAWVQVAAADGTVKQRYTAERIDPRPGSWLDMVQPRAVLYSPTGRVVSLRGDRGRAHVPGNELEIGRFEGHVVVSVWIPNDDGSPRDIEQEEPTVVINAREATFDAVRNRIDVPGEVSFSSETMQFTGETLELLLSADGRSIELLSVKRPLSPLILTRLPGAPRSGRVGSNDDDHEYVWADPPAPPVPSWRPYRLQLQDNVHITRERLGRTSSVAGDRLVTYFHLEEGASTDRLVREAMPSLPLPWPSLLLANAMATTEDVERIVVRFEGPLTMRPALAEERPPASDRMRVELDGKPVELAELPLGLRAPRVLVDLVRTAQGDQPERLVATQGAKATDGTRVIESTTLEVLMDGESGASEPKRAILTDGVRLSDAMRVASAASADVRFARGVDGKAQPRRAEMRGGVTMVEGDRTAGASELDLDFVEIDGDAQPARARLRGEVRVSDREQVLWAKELDCAFAPQEGKKGNQLARADASNGVQLQVRDGARVFADSLQSDLVTREALLRGPGLQVVRGAVRLDQSASLRVNELTRSARIDGAGRAQGFERALLADTPAAAKAAPPRDPQIRKQFEATWNERMDFVDRLAAGSTLDLKGQVTVRAEPVVGEIDLLDARQVTVEFVPRAEGAPTPAAGPTDGLAGGGDMRVSKVIAIGGAQAQNQVWSMLNGRREGDPKLVRLQGERLEFDMIQNELTIPGAGTVLVNNPAASATRSASTAGPGKTGVTRFRFQDGMQLRQTGEGRATMVMRSRVEVAHAGARQGDTMTVACGQLEAQLLRPNGGAAAAQGTIGFGGSAEVTSLIANDKVLVRTPQFECECERFEYDAATQTARLSAAPGRTIAIVPAGQAAVTRAAAFVWDLEAGRVQVDSVQGGLRR